MYMKHAAVFQRTSQRNDLEKTVYNRKTGVLLRESPRACYPPPLILGPLSVSGKRLPGESKEGKDVASSPATQSSWAGTEFTGLERDVLPTAGRRLLGQEDPRQAGGVGVGGRHPS